MYHQRAARLGPFGHVRRSSDEMDMVTNVLLASLAAHGGQGAMRPLNEARRPQRHFGKVKAAMRQVKKMLFDKRYTKIGAFLCEDKMQQFLDAVRVIIRRRM